VPLFDNLLLAAAWNAWPTHAGRFRRRPDRAKSVGLYSRAERRR
jgi:hypothetical protein